MGFDANTIYYHGAPSDAEIRELQRGKWERVPGEPAYFDDMTKNPNAMRWAPMPLERQMVWFTPNPKYASEYARRGGKDRGTIYPVFLRKDAVRIPGLRSQELKHQKVSTNEVYVTDLTAIRSIHATFDTARAADTDLLA